MENVHSILEAFYKKLNADNIDGAIDTLKLFGTGSRGTPKTAVKVKAIDYLIHKVNDKSNLMDMAIQLAAFDESTARELSAALLAAVYPENPHEVSQILRKLADDDDWEVREWAASACGDILTNHFEPFYNEMLEWTKDHSGNVRRAAALAAMYAGKARKEEYGERLLDIVEALLTDHDPYVKKNLGPFAIGDGLLRYYPDKVLARLNKWIEFENENARVNIAKIFSSAEGMKYIGQAKHIVNSLLEDERYKVKKAIIASLNKLNKKYPEFVKEFMK